MRTHFTKIILAPLCGWVMSLAAAPGNQAIDLTVPVAESVPDIYGVSWTFDSLEPEANTVTDATGTEIPLHLEAGNGKAPELAAGVNLPGTSGYGKALRLTSLGADPGESGNPRAYVNLPVENPLILAGTDFTGGLWLRFDSVQTEADQLVVLMDRGGLGAKSGPDEGHFSFFLNKDTKGFWRMGFETGDGQTLSMATSGTFQPWDLQDGTWHHLGFNYSFGGGGAGGEVTFWLDGEVVGSEAVDVDISRGGIDSATRRFSVGERAVTRYNSQFDGVIDDLFVTEGIYEFQALP